MDIISVLLSLLALLLGTVILDFNLFCYVLTIGLIAIFSIGDTLLDGADYAPSQGLYSGH